MSLVADGNGRLQGWFDIPPLVPAGAKLVEFEGAGGTQARSSFVGRGTLKIDDLRLVNTTINRRELQWNGDPLAQTFLIDRQVQIAAVDLWFTAVGPTNLLLQVRDVENGFPTRSVVAEALKTPSEITVDGWTRFDFPPTLLEAGREYALVIACNDPVSAVAVAGVGEFDAVNQRWVSSQPYQIGVLLSSSNNRTWTAHQTRDLTFRLLAADYSADHNVIYEGSTTRTVALPPVSVVDADHLMVLAAVERPTAECDVIFRVTVDGTQYEVLEAQPFTVPRFTGEVQWEAYLTGTYEASPVLYRDVHLVSATRKPSSDYVTRAMQANGGSKITCYYDALLPGTSAIEAYYENGPGNWVAMSVVGGEELGDGWQEVKREVTGFSEPETRIKLVLSGSAGERPRARNLKVAIT